MREGLGEEEWNNSTKAESVPEEGRSIEAA